MGLTRNNLSIVACLPFLAGCQQRDEFVWQLGCYVFIVYTAMLVITVLLPKFVRTRCFLFIYESIKSSVGALAWEVMLGGLIIFGIGVSRLWEKFGPEKLTILLGAIVLIGGANMLLWARADQAEERAIRLKVVLVSTSFGLCILYLMTGAALIDC